MKATMSNEFDKLIQQAKDEGWYGTEEDTAKWDELLKQEAPEGIVELRDQAIDDHRVGLTEPFFDKNQISEDPTLVFGDGQIDHSGHFNCNCDSVNPGIYKRCKFVPDDPQSGRKILPSFVCPNCGGLRKL